MGNILIITAVNILLCYPELWFWLSILFGTINDFDLIFHSFSEYGHDLLGFSYKNLWCVIIGEVHHVLSI